jgi:alkylation response protein AidB-like acyl-CoA dehydrogenase
MATLSTDGTYYALSFLIIPLNLPGVSRYCTLTSGCRASGTALITLNNVRVPVENLLGKERDGLKLVMANFNTERLNFSVMASRLSRICWSEAWSLANRRTTFGKPLVGRQVIRANFATPVSPLPPNEC